VERSGWYYKCCDAVHFGAVKKKACNYYVIFKAATPHLGSGYPVPPLLFLPSPQRRPQDDLKSRLLAKKDAHPRYFLN
jgi:hypothetical protein